MSDFVTAIRVLCAERKKCVARIAEIDQILGGVAGELKAAGVDGVAPLVPPPTDAGVPLLRSRDFVDRRRTQPNAETPPRPTPAPSGEIEQRILTALKANGTMTPGALYTAVDQDRLKVRRALYQLEMDGTIVTSGNTTQRRISLKDAGASA